MSIITGILLSLILLVSGCSQPAYVVSNNLLIAQGNYQQAIANYRELVTANPEDPDLHFYLSRALFKSGNFKDAKDQIDQALLIKPLVDRYRLLAGKISINLNSYFDAINHLTTALIINAQMLEAYYYLAIALNETGKPEQALTQLTTAISIEPLYFDAHLAWARIKFKTIVAASTSQQALNQTTGSVQSSSSGSTTSTGATETTVSNQYTELITNLENALKIKPASVEGNLLLSKIYYSIGAEYKAKVVLEKRLEDYGSDDQILYALAKLEYNSGRFEKAFEVLNKQKKHDLSSQALSLKIRARMENVPGLIKEAQKLVEKYPDEEELHVILGHLYLKDGDIFQAEQSIQKALELEPNYAEAYYYLSQIYQEQNDLSGAQWALKKSLDLAPADHEIKIHYLYSLVDNEQWTSAVDFLNTYYLDPDNPDVIFLKGVIAKERGDYSQAEQLFMSAQKRQFSVRVEVQLADSEIRQGKYYSAESRLKRIAAIYPNNIEIILSKAKLLFYEKQTVEIPSLLKPYMDDHTARGRVHLLMAEAYVQMGDIDKAIDVLADGVQKWPRHVDLIQAYTLYLGLKGKYKTAIRYLEDVQTFQNKYNQLFYYRLRSYYYLAGETVNFQNYIYLHKLETDETLKSLN